MTYGNSSIQIQEKDITTIPADIIVNAANKGLARGGGVCGAIFRAASGDKLQKACNRYRGCDTGKAVITPGYGLPSKYIIHAVGPIWSGGDNREAEKLYSAYLYSLCLAKYHNCHSIAFPLISSGIYHFPKMQAWEVAISACRRFIGDNPDYEMQITFAVFGTGIVRMGEEILEKSVSGEAEDWPVELPSEKELLEHSAALHAKRGLFGVMAGLI